MNNDTFYLLAGVSMVLLLIGLSLPPALQQRSWKRLLVALLLSAVGIVVPLGVFLASTMLGQLARLWDDYMWLDCFHLGQLVMTPLVMWACASFYTLVIYRPHGKPAAWAALGVLSGSVVSAACFVISLFMFPVRNAFNFSYLDSILSFSRHQPFYLLPLYVCVWYAIVFSRTARDSGVRMRTLAATLSGCVASFLAGLIVSVKCFAVLPYVPPECFVVTAAMRGHKGFVGPFTIIERDGRTRRANKQLLTFWRLEALWQNRSPRTHRLFRIVYNLIGPWIAARIRSRWAADAMYLCLKPFELIAAAIACRG